MFETISQQQFVTETASLSGGLVIVVDNNSKLTYEDLDEWGMKTSELTEVLILHGPYSKDILLTMIIKFFKHMNNKYITVVIYDNIITKKKDLKLLEPYKQNIKILRNN